MKMKRIFAFFFAAVLLLAMTACGKKDEQHDGSETSAKTTQSSNNHTVSTAGTTESSTDDETPESHITTPSTTEPAHTHSYTSEVTTAATCVKDGVQTFTCSCGDGYTEKIAATGHSWGDWTVKNQALVGRVGTEQRVCSTCSVVDTKDSVKNAAFNSFYDAALMLIVMNDYGSINASSLLEYASYTFDEYLDKPVASNTIFTALSERFAIDFSDTLKDDMKSLGERRFGYSATDDTFELHLYPTDAGVFKLLGYVHNGGDKYTTYYAFTPNGIDVTLNFAVELEYNRVNGKPNKYLSISRTDTLPGDMIAAD